MEQSFQLNLQQTQRLIMTPELRQAIWLLQLSSLELNDFIEEQLLENPVLEVSEEAVSENKESLEKLEDRDFQFDLDQYFNKNDSGSWEGAKEGYSYENFVTKDQDLAEYLEEQLLFLDLDRQQIFLTRFIVGNLDRWGYYPYDIEKSAADLGVEEERFMDALKIVQNLEPWGVGARNISECLRIQLIKQKLDTRIMLEIVDKHLPDIAQGKITKVASALNISPAELQKNMDFLKNLNPKPGAAFYSGQDTRFIVPDITIEKVDGEYIILVNDSSSPRLMINNTYRSIINSNTDRDACEFINNKFNSAMWLIKSIEQRRMTLYKIANALVDLQRDFLEKGIRYMEPLTLRDVAEMIEMHESTVSRAVTNKYIQTPRGMYPLKYFFSSGISNQAGDKISSQVIKDSIRELVENENPQKPLSDQKISDLLKAKGIEVARRTVGKYREEIEILPACQRKRY